MKINLVVFCLAVFLLVSCKDKPVAPAPVVEEAVEETTESEAEDLDEEEQLDELIAEEPMPVTVDELFDDFIFNFASNKRLQMERIEFPLVINSGAKKDTVQRDDWKMEHFFMHQGEYTLMFDSQEQMEHVKDTTLHQAIVEKIFLEDDFIRQYIFNRRADGRWMLSEVRNQTLPRNPNASFIDFYHRFVTDTTFQHESLSSEIEFMGPDPEDDFSQMEGVITPEFWDAFAPDLPQRMLFNVVYGRQDSAANEKIFVLRGIANGLEMELTFRRDNGQWRLVKLIE